MNKSDLIVTLAEKMNIPTKDSTVVVNTVFDSLYAALVENDRVEIRGFGSFIIKKYGSYTGRNPKTGTKIEVSPKKLPFFKVGKELKERVNGK
jgi:integration host factor subunit beta